VTFIGNDASAACHAFWDEQPDNIVRILAMPGYIKNVKELKMFLSWSAGIL